MLDKTTTKNQTLDRAVRIALGASCLAVLVLVLLVSLGAPRADALASTCGTSCDCDTPLMSTNTVWGSGDTCSEAFDDGVAQARALQSCADGVCHEEIIITTPCWWDGTHYMVDLHADYRCYDCTTTLCDSEPSPKVEEEVVAY